jgi:TRAP-type C4-dicarboxylate transport system substrate-binding protein
VKGLNALLEAINKETQGQLSVRLNLGGTLPIAATNITQAVADNVVQMGDDAFFVGSVPVGGVVRLPMFLRQRADFEKAWDIEAPYLKSEYDKKGVVLLGRYIFPENVMWSRKKLTALADVQGQKIRVISPEQAEFIKLLGGIPVTLGTSEVAAAIDRGVIDGALTASSGYGYVWRDLLKYSYRLNVSFIDSLILVNKGAWEKLQPPVRAFSVTGLRGLMLSAPPRHAPSAAPRRARRCACPPIPSSTGPRAFRPRPGPRRSAR